MQFSDIKLIIFDFDGTLAKTTKHAKKVFEKIVKKEINVRKYFGPPTKDFIGKIISDYDLKISEKKFYSIWKKMYLPYILTKKVINKDTIKTIEELKKRGYILAIITSSKRYKIKKIMKKDMSNLFDFILGSEDYKNGKPNPESLIYLMKKTNQKKKNCIYIGDNVVDIYFAKNAGIFSIGKEDYLYSEKELKKAGANKTIKSIKDLIKLL